ncbi:hypothetical protein ONA91_27455 [Micromonospora sp. DR5-3]|uniref:hypothetical protein n=1 Tax=unclassified Micromonospora TaxID=2617518 RepID=UPI0011D7B939|nr:MULTISPECIES: hypothetical protein [unclassified Micromonospora]MCW3818193.1 hypothetical protein [Micromonospora sp. DR5-3]TYC21644.1 hypothetical protein FXF52_24605 [Micromonospora sp. MP36]
MSDDIKRVAKSRADHLGGETAHQRLDERGVTRGRTGDSRTAGPPDGTGVATGVEGMPRSDLTLGDESTGGRAAEQAIGALPEESGAEIEDRTER